MKNTTERSISYMYIMNIWDMVIYHCCYEAKKARCSSYHAKDVMII